MNITRTSLAMLCGMLALCGQSETKVTFYAPNIARIVKTKDGGEALHRVETVIAKPQGVEVKKRTVDGATEYASKALVVRCDAKSGVVKFLSPKGEVLLAEKGPAVYRDRDWGGLKQVGAEQTWTLEKEEAIYGLGDNQSTVLNMRGWNALLHPRNVGDGLAAFVSVKGYGLFWDNTSPVAVRDNADGFTFESQIGNAVDYYYVYGGSIDDSIAGFREISGDVPMFPRWAYGYWQSKERYKTQWETVDVLKKYRERGIPMDGIVQDWQYWGGNPLWNAMEFTGKDFPDPKWMIKSVHDMNAKMLITIWQSFGPLTKPYRELSAKNYLFPFVTWPQSCLDQWPPRKDYPSDVKLYDNYSAEARGIYWKHLHRLYDLGIDGWWMDSTDPDHNYKEGDFEYKTSLGCTWREVRSAYPLEGTRAVYENMRKETDRRVFILTRGAALGEQRYGASVWSGDIGSSWDVLRRQIPGGLNYTMTGNPNFNCDLGGFFAGRYNNGGGVNNPNWRELYVRWMQLGTFLPMMRSHGTDIPREIYLYGKAGEPVYDALVGSIKLRYRLMPYIYTVAADASQKRGSFMRPVVADFPQDKETWNLVHQFMMGKSILVAPVLDAKYTREDNKPVGEMEGWDKEGSGVRGQGSGAGNDKGGIDWTAERTHSAYLPKGADWWCFVTGKKFSGGQKVEFPTTLASQPFFVRAGTVLPLGPDVQFNGEKPWDNLEIRVYPGADGEGELYEDDFETYACEKGAWTRIRFTWNDKARTLTIAARNGEYEGMLKDRAFTIVLPDGATRRVVYAGKEVNIKF